MGLLEAWRYWRNRKRVVVFDGYIEDFVSLKKARSTDKEAWYLVYEPNRGRIRLIAHGLGAVSPLDKVPPTTLAILGCFIRLNNDFSFRARMAKWAVEKLKD